MEAAAAQSVLSSMRSRVDAAGALAVAAPLALLAVALVVASPGLVVQDSWLALVSGREILAHGLPHVDHLTVMTSGHAWVDQQWLAQILLYGAARVGGVGLAYALSALAILSAFGVLARTAQRRGASPVMILLFLAWAVAAAPWGLQMRAQALALPFFALTLALLARDDRPARRTLLVLPVLCLWANIHGSVTVGVALVCLYAVVAVARGSRRLGAILLVLAPLSMLVSPYALDLPSYYRLMLLDPPFGRVIAEWQRTTPGPLTAAFFALAAGAFVLVVIRRRRLAVFDVLAFALTCAVALDAIRGLTWFALTALALLPPLATRRPGSARLAGRGALVFTGAAIAVIAGALVSAAARPASAYETRLPAAMVRVVQAHAQHGRRVFADDATADLLLWQLPSLRGRLGYDVRFELMTRAQIRALLTWGNTASEQPLEGYSVVVSDPAHVRRLVATGRWRMLYAGNDEAVAERWNIERYGL